ncbi:MAG TPA: outer membrane beta-barrel protein [Syntrophales bacterium]|nr:outer membrane beta-barrel protein [Syntrophales bacterium]
MRRKYNLILVPILVAFLVLASTPAAKATEAGPFYVGVFGGYVIPNDLEVSGSDVVRFDVKMKDSWMLGAKFGYIVPTFKWVAGEVEYNYLAKQDIDVAGINGDFSAHNVMANLLARYPEGRFHPYAGFGLGWSRGTFKASTIEGSADESANAFAWQILAGLNFEITPNLSADLGYRYFQSKYSLEDSDVTAKNHIIVIGVNYHF